MRKWWSVICLIVLIIHGCKEKESENTVSQSVRVKKNSSQTSPTQNQRFTRGEAINFDFTSSKGGIDSILVEVSGLNQSFSTNQFIIELPSKKVGKWKIKSKVYMGGNSETHHRTIIVLSDTEPQQLTYEIINSYPHDTQDFTQGLLIQDGFLYESTGQRGESSFKKKEIESGKLINVVDLDNSYFGEGLAFIDNKFYQITWTSGVALVYDLDMNQINTLNYPGDGWGLTSYKDNLIMTQGKEEILIVDPETFATENFLEAYNHIEKVDSLNELEVINDKLYANIWLRQLIVEIDLATGEVLSEIDMTGLLSNNSDGDPEEINGIAYDQENDRIFVTGKDWSKLFEVRFVPKNIAIMTLEEATGKIQKLAEKHQGKFDGKANFQFEDGTVHLDDTVTPAIVTNDVIEAPFTIKMTGADFAKILSGDLNVMMAFMTGKLKIEGDKGAAMKLTSLF